MGLPITAAARQTPTIPPSLLMIIPSRLHQPAESPSPAPDIPSLVRWLASWIQESGAIHGFHNHSVWGGNPYRWGDFSAGHTTFSAFMIPVLARLHARGNEEAGEFLARTLAFQLASRQPDGQFEHIGFQVGESLRLGLIHCMVPCIAMHLALAEMEPAMAAAHKPGIVSVVSAVLSASRFYGDRATESSCANQEYARQWVRLLQAPALGDSKLLHAALEDLKFLGERFLVRGVPDDSSCGVLRVATDPDFIEPAEYYGLMIEPLLLAHELTGQSVWLEQACSMARHVTESAWTDRAGQTRFHRLYYRMASSRYERICEPMLIAGMGLTLEGIRKCLMRSRDAGMEEFLNRCHATYSHYQSPAGYFVSASGWHSEADIAPCPAWHSHDAWHLLNCSSGCAEALDLKTGASPRLSVLMGESCFYAEMGPHWTVADYATCDVFSLLGRKDQVRFGRDMMWIGGPRALPANYSFPLQLRILRTDSRLIACAPLPEDAVILNASGLPFEISVRES